ncbi:MAG TPA: glutamate--tRNA ligase [Solirubrobacteraceae bacterium]|jgi:glutamyl-tRNA synthetase|nr:glutamate--tRNA ligase [Solirubrobacteraceae bacterium]
MRVRFAPSPTGSLHIGGARTALFNWLLARGAGGRFVLRIEDTDRERSTAENVEQILDALRWLELDWDEGPIFQTSLEERHREVVENLLGSGRAYRSRATAEDVAAFKARHGDDRGFRGEAQADGAVRLRVPDEGDTTFEDLVLGEVRSPNRSMDDLVIARADTTPLYNLAVAVDDLDLEITHVIRGNDHLTNTAKQLLVFEALGAQPPRYAHVPLLHGPDGKKLSKRHGAASVQELRAAGYLPAAVRNYVALLGWGAGDDETILSTEELIRRFDIARVQRNPAQFDEQKLRWMNGRYMRELSLDQLTAALGDFYGRDDLGPAAAISAEKLQTLAEFWPLCGFIYDGPADDPPARERWLGTEGREVLSEVRDVLGSMERFDEESIEAALGEILTRRGLKPREVYQPLRVALAGRPVSPGIFETAALLGRDEVLSRIERALNL